jgi:hypothetical protein
MSVTELPERATLRAVPTTVPDGILSFSTPCGAVAKAYVAAKGKIGRIVADLTGNVKTEKANYSYKYADLASVIAAVSPAFQENGLAVLQGVSTDARPDHLTVETMLLHESGEWIRSSLSMRPAQNTPQGLGSTITYARRYALLAMAGVAPEEDDDGAKGSHGCGHDEQQIREDAVRRQGEAARIGALLAKRMSEGLTPEGTIALCKQITDDKVAEWTTLDSFGALQAFRAALKAWKPPAIEAPSESDADVAPAAQTTETAQSVAPAVAETASADPPKTRRELMSAVVATIGLELRPKGGFKSPEDSVATQNALQQTLGYETGKPLKDYSDPELAAYLALKAAPATEAAPTEAEPAKKATEAVSGRIPLGPMVQAEMRALIDGKLVDDDLLGFYARKASNGATSEWMLLTVDEAMLFREFLRATDNRADHE